jgi:hypothetical protein
MNEEILIADFITVKGIAAQRQHAYQRQVKAN